MCDTGSWKAERRDVFIFIEEIKEEITMKAQPVSSTSLMNMLSSCESDVQDLGKSSKCIINMHPNSQKYNMMVEEYDSNHDDLWGTSGMLYQTIQSSDEEETSRCSSRESSCSSQRAKLKNLAVYKVRQIYI